MSFEWMCWVEGSLTLRGCATAESCVRMDRAFPDNREFVGDSAHSHRIVGSVHIKSHGSL